MTTRIENVLKARDPTLTDENDWEEFSLTDVRVQIPGKSRYANLLSASDEYPVTVIGRLEIVEEDQESLVLDNNYRSKRVVLENVTHYAYGQHEDGEVGIWAAGHAGWFSISPSRGYKTMYNEMVEAIDLLYFIVDKHQARRRRKRRWNPKVDFLFQEYTKHTHGACEDAEDSAEVFYKHREFLITQMLRGKEGVDWPVTPIYAHLRQKFPDDFERLKTALQALSDASESDSESGSDPGNSTKDTNDTFEERAQADTIFEVILDMKESGLLSKRKLNIQTLAEALLKRYEMDSLDYALDLIRARARYIMEMMDNAQTSTFDWSRKVIYNELKAATYLQGLDTVGAAPLHPRRVEVGEPSSVSSDDSDDEVPIPKGRGRGVGKSLLRPKLSTVSAKGAGKRNRQSEPDMTDSDADFGRVLSYEESPSKAHDDGLVHDALVNESVHSMASHSATSSLNFMKHHDKPEFTATMEIRNGGPPVTTNVHMDLPTDAWVCPVRGCGKTVLKANSKRSKEMIADHSLMHADDTKTKLDLVLSEHRLNVNASVTHLLEKIQGLASVKDPEKDNIPHPSGEDISSPSRKKVKL
ncbi:hypothetical protein VTO42DRAFT_1874 [Malbranchea cinnamomea]